MQQFDLTISGRKIPVSIDKHRRFRRCSMRLTDKGLMVTIPSCYSDRQLDTFINQNSSWILRKYSQQKSRIDNMPQLVQGGNIPFNGELYPVDMMPISDVLFTGEKFHIPDCENRKSLLSQWYIKEAGKITLNLINIWRSELGEGLKEVKLKNMRSRWGSCTARGKVSLNWRLIMAPETVFEYVFVHELCHLSVRSHGTAFWKLVEREIPNLKKHRTWLRKNGYMLTNFPEPVNTSSTVASIEF